MATVIARHRVANFEKWKRVFDSSESLREKYGFVGHSIHRDVADPNIVVVVNRVRDLTTAKNYGASKELHEAMADAGVQGVPEMFFLDDVVEELRVGAKS